ncbi:hypothetical protein [Pseudomonas oryzihabitans]|nr:hypothetical protein [Pseudomonas psychrotolerans]MDR6676875.1 hypothetical protein [Pseudomonas psychrotolerans]
MLKQMKRRALRGLLDLLLDQPAQQRPAQPSQARHPQGAGVQPR